MAALQNQYGLQDLPWNVLNRILFFYVSPVARRASDIDVLECARFIKYVDSFNELYSPEDTLETLLRQVLVFAKVCTLFKKLVGSFVHTAQKCLFERIHEFRYGHSNFGAILHISNNGNDTSLFYTKHSKVLVEFSPRMYTESLTRFGLPVRVLNVTTTARARLESDSLHELFRVVAGSLEMLAVPMSHYVANMMAGIPFSCLRKIRLSAIFQDGENSYWFKGACAKIFLTLNELCPSQQYSCVRSLEILNIYGYPVTMNTRKFFPRLVRGLEEFSVGFRTRPTVRQFGNWRISLDDVLTEKRGDVVDSLLEHYHFYCDLIKEDLFVQDLFVQDEEAGNYRLQHLTDRVGRYLESAMLNPLTHWTDDMLIKLTGCDRLKEVFIELSDGCLSGFKTLCFSRRKTLRYLTLEYKYKGAKLCNFLVLLTEALLQTEGICQFGLKLLQIEQFASEECAKACSNKTVDTMCTTLRHFGKALRSFDLRQEEKCYGEKYNDLESAKKVPVSTFTLTWRDIVTELQNTAARFNKSLRTFLPEEEIICPKRGYLVVPKYVEVGKQTVAKEITGYILDFDADNILCETVHEEVYKLDRTEKTPPPCKFCRSLFAITAACYSLHKPYELNKVCRQVQI